jgi:phospholipid/cholesterol/gamma-HCH transport system substrate-binding protein
MNPNHAGTATKIRVGLFTIMGIALIGAMTVFVNDKPFWWRQCDLIYMNVEDATGLKAKSPIRSLGLQIGYLKSVELTETYVRLGVCVTAPVEIIPDTRAYIRGEGFLGDKFVELKPVRYVGSQRTQHQKAEPVPSALPVERLPEHEESPVPGKKSENGTSPFYELFRAALGLLLAEAHAAPENQAKEVPMAQKQGDVDKLISQVDSLVGEMTKLTTNLKDTLNPKDLKTTLDNLNRALENASKTLSPEGGLNRTAQRALGKLEDAIEQLRDQMTRINQGQGSLGQLLNDPIYAEEVKKALKSVNKILGRTSEFRFNVNFGAEQINGYQGGRGYFLAAIWPSATRYYLLGAGIDPRGRLRIVNTRTTAGGTTTNIQTTETDETGLQLTIMLGKKFTPRLEGAMGALHGDGTISAQLNLGPIDMADMVFFRVDGYARGAGASVNARASLQAHPFYRNESMNGVYVRGGLETFRQVGGQTAYFFGAGVQFDDDDIKILFALR